MLKKGIDLAVIPAIMTLAGKKCFYKKEISYPAPYLVSGSHGVKKP